MSCEKLKEISALIKEAGKKLGYTKATLNSLNSSKNTFDNFILATLLEPKNGGMLNKVSAAFLLTEDGIKIVSNFMSINHLFYVSEEEILNYPLGYKIYQDDEFAYIVTELPSDITSVFKAFNSIDKLFLSKKTSCQYDKISDYLKNYQELRDAIKTENDSVLAAYCSHAKQILEPLCYACSVLLGKPNYAYTQTQTQLGNFVVLRFTENSEASETGICLLIEDSEAVSLKKVIGKTANGFSTIDVPNKVYEFINIMQTKPKTSAK